MEITREIFEQQRRPRFGNANPERMQFAFWEWMIRGDPNAHTDRRGGFADENLAVRDGKLKSPYGPCRARDLFEVPPDREDGPIWTFDRMGATQNQLADGRVIRIGGEHEDFYDPDFYIYNDVVVHGMEEEIVIYGYPRGVFPPTDFHTATLAGKQVIIIGGLGYKNERTFGHTPVYALDLTDFHIDKIETSGAMPGWIHKHTAEIDDAGVVTIRSGEIVRDHNGDQLFVSNFEDHALDLNSRAWRQTTDNKWYQARIWRQDKRPLPLKPYSKAEALLPRTIPYTLIHCEWRSAKIQIENVEVSVKVGISDIKIMVKGHLPRDLLTRVSEEIQMNAQILMGCRCSLQPL